MIDSQGSTTEVVLLSDNMRQTTDIIEPLSAVFSLVESDSARNAFELASTDTSGRKLVLLDLVHAKEQCLTFLNMRKATVRLKTVPVLSIARSHDLPAIIKAYGLGSSDYIPYPFSPLVLIARIRELSELAGTIPRRSNPRFLDAENGFGFFSYEPNRLQPVFVSNQVLAANNSADIEEFRAKVQNLLELFGDEARIQLEWRVAKAAHEKGSFSASMPDLSLVLQFSWVPFKAPDGKQMFYVGVLNETDRQNQQRFLENKLELDTLTGLYNREAFYHRAERLVKEHPKTTYVYIRWNIIRFKLINDMFGNHRGDSILRQIAGEFLGWTGDQGVCGRLYSDHFAFCIPKHLFDENKFAAFSRNLLRSACKNMNLQISFGIYEIADKTLSIENANDRAKLAMRSVKESDTTRFAYYDEAMRLKIRAAQKVVDSFEQAMEGKQFVIYLQPIYDITVNKFVSAEALVRWVTPERGVVPPLEFIPLFEENGYIQRLDLYVLEQVCILQRSLIDEGMQPIPISSNLSRIDFFNPDLHTEIISIVDRYDLPHSLIRLEITETAYMENPKQLLNTVTILQRQGFEILMDDFGSGYSSLNILQDVPIDILKLDQLFTSQIGLSNKAETIVRNIVNMARGIELRVIAEGIETKAQATFFKSVGCEHLQGYYFSKPLPEKDFRLLLGDNEIKLYSIRKRKQLEIPFRDQLAIRYGKLLQSVFLAVFEVNYSQQIFKTLFADNTFTNLPYGTAGSLSEVQDQMVIHLVHPDDRNRYRKESMFYATQGHEEPGSFKSSDFRVLNRNGFYHPLSRIMVKQKHPTQEHSYLSFWVHDKDKHLASLILESIDDLERQRIAEQQYRIIHEESNIIVFEWDTENKTFSASKGLEDFRISKANMPLAMERMAFPFSVTLPEEDRKIDEFWQKSARSKNQLNCEIFHLKKLDGSYAPALIRLFCSSNCIGRQKRIIGTISILDEKPAGWNPMKKNLETIVSLRG
jgi:diguanylate cyclase (GGDEF)-like protein